MARTRAELSGLADVMRNLNREISEIKGRTSRGVRAAGALIIEEAKNRVPVEYGQLRDSGYALTAPDDPLAVDIGFTAPYALYVHENMEQKLKGKPRPSGIGVYWGPHGQPKFLESAINDLQGEAVAVVAESAKIR